MSFELSQLCLSPTHTFDGSRNTFTKYPSAFQVTAPEFFPRNHLAHMLNPGVPNAPVMTEVSPAQCSSYSVSPVVTNYGYMVPMAPEIMLTQPTPVSQGACVLESPYMPMVLTPSTNCVSDGSQNSIQVFNFDVGSNGSSNGAASRNERVGPVSQNMRGREPRRGNGRADPAIVCKVRGRPSKGQNTNNVTTRTDRLKLLKRIVKDEVGCGSVCWHWTRRGYCNYGDSCQFRHPTQHDGGNVMQRRQNMRRH